MPRLKRLPQRTALVGQVVEQLRSRILSRATDVGAELPPEGTLVEAFGVSRTVIREAMQVLRSQGLVEVSQGRRPRVKSPDPQVAIDHLDALLQRSDGSLLDLVEARRPLESEIAFLAAQRATPSQMEEMARAITELRLAANLDEQIDADMRFHELLAKASGNLLFHMLLSAIWGLFRQSVARTTRRAGAAVAADSHQRILDAVRRRNAGAARQAMLDHMRVTEETLCGAKSAKNGRAHQPA
jgi:GntR family transcriptional repressor for pyruvate dehydrogenase complex